MYEKNARRNSALNKALACKTRTTVSQTTWESKRQNMYLEKQAIDTLSTGQCWDARVCCVLVSLAQENRQAEEQLGDLRPF